MRKRITGGLMAMIMVFSLIFHTATPVYAASDRSSSEDVIEFIKKLEGFSATAFWDVNQWTIGYGTTGEKGQTMTEKEADEAMRDHLAEIDEKINDFAAKYGLRFSQNEHDALASFSFNVGTTWTKESGRFHNAIVNGADTDELLFAFSLWANVDGLPDRTILKRRMCEANMFLNDTYSKSMPSSISYVIFDANGGVPGSGGEDKMQGYLVKEGADILVRDPAKSGREFLGWYTERVGGQKVTRLDDSTALMILYAHYDGDEEEEIEDSTEVIATGRIVCETYVNIRKGAGTDYSLAGQAINGVKVKIYEIKKAGTMKWARTQLGWISMDYIELDDEIDSDKEIPEKNNPNGEPGVVVNANVVNVRKAAGTSNPVTGTLKLGTKVMVYEQVTKDNAPWGRIDQGWICMNYVRLNADDFEEADPDEAIASGKVSSSTNLNVRSGPGTTYERVNFLAPGSRISVYEIRTAGGERWGRIGEKRWVSLSYVTLDSEKDKDEDPRNDSEGLYDGYVGNSGLNVRSGPGTDYTKVGALPSGTRITVYQEKQSNGMTWGRIDPDDGKWVCLNYITKKSGSSSDLGTGTVTSQTGLNVRSGAGTNYKITSQLRSGSKVTILERKTSGGLEWGHIDKGWICMSYVRMD